MAAPTLLTIPSSLAERYEVLAEQAGQPREDLMLVALADYLDARMEDKRRLEAAIAAAARGEVVDAEAANAETEALLLSRGLTREQLATIRAEVFTEMEDAYGISLCE